MLFDGCGKLSISTPLTDITSISLYFTPNGSSITTAVDVGVSKDIFIGEAGTYSAQINSNGDSKSTGNLVVETILHRAPRVIKTIPNTTATTNEIISSFESLVNYFGDVDVDTLTFSISNPNTSIAQAYITGNSLTIDQRYKLNGIVTFTLTATDPREATVSFSFDWTHNQTITASITNESNTITIAGTTSKTGTMNVYSQDETRTPATLLGSGTSDSAYNFSITFTDSRDAGAYSYYVSLIDSYSNIIKYIDVGLTATLVSLFPVFNNSYTTGSHTWIAPGNGKITVELQGGKGGNYRSGGAGGYITINVDVQKDAAYNVMVAGAGSGAGGRHGASGGGASGFEHPTSRWMVVAGGGGGAADDGNGGNGGAPFGWNGGGGGGGAAGS